MPKNTIKQLDISAKHNTFAGNFDKGLNMFRQSFYLLGCLLLSAPVYAHEFWISPVDFQIEPQSPIAADFRVGQKFNGGIHSYLSNDTTRHEIHHAGQMIKVPAREGDRPGFQHTGLPGGLAILVHETTDSTLTYHTFYEFNAFVAHKGFAGLAEAHRARDLPEVDFVESYRRFAKSLIAVGDGTGRDRPVGLKIEIVALRNPYTSDPGDGMRLQVLLDGQPRPDVQVEVFDRPIGSKEPVQITLYRTDANGIAQFPLSAGREYMVDNVALVALQPVSEGDPVWRSLWANLTFAVPGN
jgi:uncharacterized GH25 family protein